MFKLLVTVVPVTESKGWRGEQEGQRPSSGWVCGGVCSAIPTIHSKTIGSDDEKMPGDYSLTLECTP